MTTQSTIKAVRPNRLSEDETLTSFEDWRNNLEFYLNQDADFRTFLTPTTTWHVTGNDTAHRGLGSADDARHLCQFLGVIASLSPPLLHGDITNDTKSLSDIYKLLRSYYQFAPSESTFMKFAVIKREIVGGNLERPLHLYLRMRQFIRDNLLSSSGRIQHDGTIPTSDEKLSPTTERLVVLRWLEILHPALPAHISQVFAQDLQTTSLKDLQPRLVSQIDDLLLQVETKEGGLDAQFSRVSTKGSRFDNYDNRRFSGKNYDNRRDDYRAYHKPSNNRNFSTKSTQHAKKAFISVKKCQACRAVGEPFIGHEIRNCPNIMPSDRENIVQSFNLDVDEAENDCSPDNFESANVLIQEGHSQEAVDVDRVNIGESPRFNVKLNKTMVTMLLDTGATGSMISLEICELANLRVYPTSHNATLADGDSQLQVIGEVHTSILLDNYLTLPISAVVVTRLKAGFIVGMAFMERHKIVIDIPNSSLIFPDNKIVKFANKPGNPKLSLLRVEVSEVIFPGDTFTLSIPTNFLADKSFAIEPREHNVNWPEPSIVENDEGRLVMTNNLDHPMKLKKNQVIAQIRSVIDPLQQMPSEIAVRSNTVVQRETDFTHEITIDPDNILSEMDKKDFSDINKTFNSVFNSKIGTYNDKSGKVRASVCLGNNLPVPRKGYVPCYSSKNSALLQEKFDELVNLGVLSHPEDVNVDVIHTSPSFLVKKPDGSHRLVTSFVELNKYLRPLPTKMTTTEDVITGMGKWKHIIKTDLKSAYFQIPVKKDSQKWLGTISPFKGMFVYNVAPQGLRNMAEYLEELIARVFGDFMAEGWLLKIADDLVVGSNSLTDLKQRWKSVLSRLQENNLSVSAKKTYICPTSVKIVGWIWRSGQLEVDSHRINPLTVCSPPITVKQLRSFLGAARIVSRCIPHYAKFLCDLEDLVAGKESSSKIHWTEVLQEKFKEAQKALSHPKVITIPHPDDQLILVSDGCNSPPAVGSTLFVKRGTKEYIGGFFSAKIKKHQLLWLACEIEALCINLSINSFSNFIRESHHTTKFLTDSKSCVEAFANLSKGRFSLSPRISSFLMNLNSLNVSLNHVKGSSIMLTDFSSRNPIECIDKACQICRFVQDNIDIAVESVKVDDVEKGLVKMPFSNKAAWRETQKQDPDLKRTFSQLSAGTRPGKKEKNLKNVRKYLQVASISNDGTLVHRKSNPYGRDFELIIVPQSLVTGLVSALHLRLSHPFKSQLKKVWDRSFYALDIDNIIDYCTESCSLCRSLKKMPKELFQQNSSQTPNAIGKVFAVDVIRRENQKIIVALDVFSSFVLGQLIPNEQSETLEQSLIHLVANYKHKDGCVVRVDNAPGFIGLKNSQILSSIEIKLDFGRIKNKKQNPTIDKAIQEVEQEITRIMPSGGALSPSTLAIALSTTNNRIRSHGLSAKEILLKRDNITNEPLYFVDSEIGNFKYEQRLQNHASSEKAKARGNPAAKVEMVSKGDIVHVKNDLSKHRARDFYLVTYVDYKKYNAEIQKFCGNHLKSKKYAVNLDEIYLASPHVVRKDQIFNDGDGIPLRKSEGESLNTAMPEDDSELATPSIRSSSRIRNPPDWLSTGEIERCEYS